MQRRDFLKAVGAASLAPGALEARRQTGPTSPAATVLYDDRSVALNRVGPSSLRATGALWIRKRDLPRVNGFELKPQGACRADLCIPIPKAMKRGDYFNLTAFAKKAGQQVVAEPRRASGALARCRRSAAGSRIPASRLTSTSPIAGVVPCAFRFPRQESAGDHLGVLVRLPLDLPGWQKLYTELKDHNFEIVAAAQDVGGEAAAGRWYDAAGATFTQLVDTKHTVSSVFQFINVPMGVWIDESGRVVRPAEPAWAASRTDVYGGKPLETEGELYVAALRDWVANGDKSEVRAVRRRIRAA